MVVKPGKQAQVGVPHSETQLELQSYFNWGQVSVGGDTAHFVDGGNNWGGDTAHCTTLKERA